MKRTLLFLVCMVFLLSSVSAIDDIGTFPTNNSFELIQICDSCTYVNLSHVVFPNGTVVSYNVAMTKTSYLYNYSYSTLTEGDYQYTVCGDKLGTLKCETFSFSINEGGVPFTEGRSTLVIGLLGLLVSFLFLSLFALFKVEDYRGKFALYWVSHVLMIIITFIAWQIGVEGLLGSTAVVSIFRMFFLVFSIGAFPMMILSLAWIFYIHTFNEHFQKLVDKGEDPEKAFAMTEKRKKGWFSGS